MLLGLNFALSFSLQLNTAGFLFSLHLFCFLLSSLHSFISYFDTAEFTISLFLRAYFSAPVVRQQNNNEMLTLTWPIYTRKNCQNTGVIYQGTALLKSSFCYCDTDEVYMLVYIISYVLGFKSKMVTQRADCLFLIVSNRLPEKGRCSS